MKRLITGIALVVALSVGVNAAESPIAEAAARGDREAVKSLLKKAADVNAAQGDGMTALHWAAMNGDLELAEMLIVAGANVRATTRLGTYTPLYLASQQGHGADHPGARQGRRRPEDRHAERHHAVDGGRRRRRSGRGQSADRERRRRERERRRSRADAADVCRGLESRRRDRAARGEAAPISRRRARSSNLANLSREGLGFGGNPQVPGGGAGAAPAPPAARRCPASTATTRSTS